ncbi:hypothetical protein ACGIF2_16695 [Cellulomonas sp. P22]|uniref:hypothetical protein n=1 Tax=Cellulomonas sp. P22 TaxID=3373189 RepID=UPI0037AD1492
MPLHPLRRPLVVPAVLVVAALTVGVGPAAQAPTVRVTSGGTAGTASTASQLLTPEHGMLVGAFVQPRDGQGSEAAVATFEQATGRKLDLQRWYARWDEPMPPAPVVATLRRGRTPVLSIEPRRLDGSKVSWASIASGAHDAEIRAQAAGVASLVEPVFLVLHHEPDQAAGYGTPAEFRAAWRHYVEVVRDAGVTNVAWTWVVTPGSFGSAPSTAGADAFYPGDDVVDWIALDPYNWYGCAPSKPPTWRSLAEVAGPFRRWAQGHDKPLMLAEWGTVEDPADAGRKARWYTEALETLATWPEVKAVSIFHQLGTCAWWVDSSTASLAGYARAVSAGVTHGRASAWLVPSTTHGSAPLAVTFDASGSTGAGSPSGSGVVTWELDPGDGSPTARGVGTPPAALGHTYGAGGFAARLTVTDATGATSTDTVAVTSAPAPTVALAEGAVDTTGAELRAWVDPRGHAATVHLTWAPTDPGTTDTATTDAATTQPGAGQGDGTGAGDSGGTGEVWLTVPAVTYARALSHRVDDLLPGTSYTWTVTASSDAGSTTLSRTFRTAGPPTTSSTWSEDRTSTSVTLRALVHPNRLPTQVWFEWGPAGEVPAQTSPTLLDATFEKSATVTLSRLLPATTYTFRVVAQNTMGLTRGPLRTVTTSRQPS